MGEAKGTRPTEADVLRNLNLPTDGDVPFVPPNGWHPTQPLPTRRGGYIDRKGRIWTKGRSITPGQHFEWDVQLPHGDHLNVDWGGTITHPKHSKPKVPETKTSPPRRQRKDHR